MSSLRHYYKRQTQKGDLEV